MLPLYANAIFEVTFQICASCCGLSLDKPLENFSCVRRMMGGSVPVHNHVIDVMMVVAPNIHHN